MRKPSLVFLGYCLYPHLKDVQRILEFIAFKDKSNYPTLRGLDQRDEG